MIFSRRVHAIELLDIPRCPRAIRDGATDYLHFIIRFGNAYVPIVPVLSRALAANNLRSVVDLCAGAGGPWPELRTALVHAGAPPELRVSLTDLYPNEKAFAEIAASDSMVEGVAKPLNIECEPVLIAGVRTFFSSFHHFAPPVAKRVLRNAAHTREPIFIAEVTQRSAKTMLFILLSPLIVWLVTPLLRPFTWSRLGLTYLIPAIPFVVCFDGIVSCLRTYSPDELRTLFSSMEDLSYNWQVGLARGRGRLPVTYALGVPRSVDD